MAADNNNEEENHIKAWIEGNMLKVEYYGETYDFDLTKYDEREIERGRFSVVLFDETKSFCVKISSGNSRGVTRNDIDVHNYLEEKGLLSKLDSPFIAQLNLENEGSFKERTDIYFMKNMRRFGAATLDELIDFEETKRENERNGKEVKGYEVTTKTLSLPYALSFYKKLLSQLGILHNAGVIHLDVTHGNVFLKHYTEAEGSHRKKRMRKLKNVILIDDGLARKRDSPIGLFFNQTRAVGSRSAGSYKTCYKGHSGRKTAWYNEDTSPPELMMTNSSDLPAVPSMDIYQATNLLVWTLTGKSAFYLKGRHLTYMMYLLDRALQDEELETLDNNRFKTEKKSIDDKIKQSARELQSLYMDLIVATEGKDKAGKIESEINSGVYTTLLECVDLLYSHKLKQIIERKNADILVDDSSKQFLDALLPILVRGTGDLKSNYTSVEDLLAPDKSLGELDKLEKSHPNYFKYEFVDDVIGEDAQESLSDKVGGLSLLNGLRKVGEFIGVIPKSLQPASSAQQPQPPASSATSSAIKQPQPIPSRAVPPPPPKQPLAASPSAQPSAPQQPLVAQPSTTTGEEETIILEDEVEKEVSKLERKLEKGKTPKVPLRINLLAQLKEKYAPWYQRNKKAVVIAASAALLGVGGLSYYLINKYDLCCPRSLDIICGEDTCSEPAPKPAPEPEPKSAPTPPASIIPKPSGTPRVADYNIDAKPKRRPEGIKYLEEEGWTMVPPPPITSVMKQNEEQKKNFENMFRYWWFELKQVEDSTEKPHTPQTSDLGKIHVSDPIEIDLIKKGIDGVKTLDDLVEKFDPEKGIGEINADKNKIQYEYIKEKGKIRITPAKKDGKPYLGQAQLSIKTEDGYCLTYCFEFSNKKPEAIKQGGVIEVPEHGKREIDLRDYFKDDGDKDSLAFSYIFTIEAVERMRGKIEVERKDPRHIILKATEPDFFSQQKEGKYTLDSVVKVRFKASDENYEVENWFWVAVTPVNDCPRVEIANRLRDVLYVPFASSLDIMVKELFYDPEGDKLIPLTTSRSDMTLSYEIGGEQVTVEANGNTKLERKIDVDIAVEDNVKGSCQLENGDLSNVNSTEATLTIYYHDVEYTDLGDGYHIKYRILDKALAKKQSIGDYDCDGYASSIVLGDIEKLLTSAKQAEEETGEVKYKLKGYSVRKTKEGKAKESVFTPISGSPTHYTANITNYVLPFALTFSTDIIPFKEGMICIEVIEFTKSK